MRPADPPGQRVEPEQDRSEVGREVPGKVVIPRVRQLVGEDRPQVVGPHVVALPIRQEQDRTPEPGQAGRRDVRRPTHPDRPMTSQPLGDPPAFASDRVRNRRRSPDDPRQPQAPHDQPGRQHEDTGQPDRPQSRDEPISPSDSSDSPRRSRIVAANRHDRGSNDRHGTTRHRRLPLSDDRRSHLDRQGRRGRDRLARLPSKAALGGQSGTSRSEGPTRGPPPVQARRRPIARGRPAIADSARRASHAPARPGTGRTSI